MFNEISSYLKNQIIGQRYRTNRNLKLKESPSSAAPIVGAMKQNNYRKRKQTFNVISPKSKLVDGIIMNQTIRQENIRSMTADGVNHRFVAAG